MNGQRALEISNSFATGRLAFTAKEIEELLKATLVVEVDPDDFATLGWLNPIVTELLETGIEDPEATAKMIAKLAELDERLKSDWHRFTTSDAHLAKEEQQRRNMKRALAVLNDRIELARLVKVATDARTVLPNGAQYYACKELGDELYAITNRGLRVVRALALRIDRYREVPLTTFLKAFDKTEVKMQAFGGEIATLSRSIGYVKKNPHQVVIGLVKTGKPAAEALGTYHQAVRQTGAADVAVTLARNAAAFGGTGEVQARLERAIKLLQHAGFPWIPATFGAAKTLLPFEPLEAGVHRFEQIALALAGKQQARTEATIKLAARLMPADGAPDDVVRRAQLARTTLKSTPSQVRKHGDETATAVALAAMVRTDDAVAPLVTRLRAVEAELARLRIDADPLECVACPGSPVEVAATVQALMFQVAKEHGRAPNHADAAVAAAFAKRFAY